MLYYETIESSTLELLKKLQKVRVLHNARLVGGTALALQIGHRKSVDLDFFGEITVDHTTLTDQLSVLGNLQVLKASAPIYIYLLNHIKIDIVNYPYPWLEEGERYDGLRLGGLKDIAAMKLAAITGRGTKKDFIDIYFLSKLFSLADMLSFYEQKYPDGSSFLVLKSLSYFEDAEYEPMPYMLSNEITWKEVKKHILSVL